MAAGIEVRTGGKWSAKKELENAEERLRQKAHVGTVVIGQAGLGYFPSTQIHKANRKQRRNLIQEEVRASVEEGKRGKWWDYPGKEHGRDGKTLWKE